MKLLTLLFIMLKYIYSYRILSRNFIVYLDGSSNQGRIVETVQYDFENLSVPIQLKKYYPQIDGNITNATVSSNFSNVINSWTSYTNGTETYFLVNITKNLLNPVNLVFTYQTSGLMNQANQSLNMNVSNSDSTTDINTKIDVVLEKIHGIVTPKNIFLDKNYEFGYFYDNINDLYYKVRVDKDTVLTTYREVVLAKRENKLKKEDNRTKNYKISFNEVLKKGASNQIIFRVEAQKPKGGASFSSSSSSSAPMTRPPPPVNNNNPSRPSNSYDKQYSNNYNHQQQYNQKRNRSSGSSSVWEAIIAFLYVACLIFLCYECCTYCCGSSEANKAGAEGEYIYVCN
jgi:hypothetical protein